MKKRTKRIVIWSIVGVLVAIVAAAAIWFFAVYQQVNNFNKHGDESPFYQVQPSNTKAADEPPKWEGTERVNILLMGVDARGIKKGEVPRSDSMMVASIDPVQKKAYLFSILRDTYVDIPDHGEERINTAITHGPDVAMKTVSNVLGIPIQYYVYTDFQGFSAVVDAIGGIDFDVEKNMHYVSAADKHEYDIDLKKGMQHLDGKTALEYVRFRHDAMSDFARADRQRNFITAVADKLKNTTNIMNLPGILNKVNPYIDTNMTVTDMWKLATIGYKSNVTASEQLPPMDLLKEEKIGGAAVIGIKDEDALKAYVQDTFNRADPSSEGPSGSNAPGNSSSPSPSPSPSGTSN